MDLIKKIIVGLYIIMITIITLTVVITNAQNKACEEIGYEKFRQTENFAFCVDSNDNLHYVDWNYEIFPYRIGVKEISVGDVRVVGG